MTTLPVSLESWNDEWLAAVPDQAEREALRAFLGARPLTRRRARMCLSVFRLLNRAGSSPPLTPLRTPPQTNVRSLYQQTTDREAYHRTANPLPDVGRFV
jgi:hypothetical protein